MVTMFLVTALVGGLLSQSTSISNASPEHDGELVISVARERIICAVCPECSPLKTPLAFDGVGIVSGCQANEFKRAVSIGIYDTEDLARRALFTKMVERPKVIQTPDGHGVEMDRGFAGTNGFFVRERNAIVSVQYMPNPQKSVIMAEATATLATLTNSDAVKLGRQPKSAKILGRRLSRVMIEDWREGADRLMLNTFIGEMEVDMADGLILLPNCYELRGVHDVGGKYLFVAQLNGEGISAIFKFARSTGEVTVVEVKYDELKQVTRLMPWKKIRAIEDQSAASKASE